MKNPKKLLCLRVIVVIAMLNGVVLLSENILKNPGFEEISTVKNFTLYWGKSHCYIGDISIVTDALQAHLGSNAIKVDKTRKGHAAFCYQKIKVNKDREINTSVWVKGKGDFYVYYYLYGNTKFLGSRRTDLVKVDSDKWEKYEFSITIPEKSGEKILKKIEGVTYFSPAFHVIKGTVFFDDIKLGFMNKSPKDIQQENANISIKNHKVPYVRIPKTSKPPNVDGVIDKDEWKNASAITGFLEQGTGALSPQQSVFFMSYDNKNLYFALKSVVKGNFKKGVNGRDNIKINSEAFEIWINPQGKEWYQFLGVPAGGFMDISSKDRFKWNGNIKYVSKFEDSGETAGGVLTFNKTYWNAEVVIPLKDIGINSPLKNNTVWRMNFCRDLGTKRGKERTSKDWTTWSSIKGGFKNIDMFGYVEFGGKCSAMQLLGLGDPANGLISVNGKIASPLPENITLNTTIKTASGKPILNKNNRFNLKARDEKLFSFEDILKLSRTSDLILEFSASNPDTGKSYIRAKAPFTCNSSFDVKVVPVYVKGFVDIILDVSKVEGVDKNCNASVKVEGTGLSGVKAISSPENKITFRFDISKLKVGNYTVKNSVVNKNKQIIVSNSMPLPIPQKPEWLGNKIGISDKVPVPWKPIRTDGKTISITDRKYILGDNGLPAQINSLGKSIFSEKPSIKIAVGGKTLNFTFELIRNISGKDTESVWEIKGRSDDLTLHGTLRIEYDGFSLYKFDITPLKPIDINALYIDFPLNKDVAMYVRAMAYLPKYKSCSASLYKEFSSAKKVDIGGKWIYNPGWIWADVFFNEIWIGNDRIGFALMTESDENIKGEKHIEIISEKDMTLMRVNLISSPTRISKTMSYEYAWEATPVKPETKNPKLWHASYFSRWSDDYLKRQYVGAQYHILNPSSYPKLRNHRNAKSILNNAHNFGAKVVPDFYLSSAAYDTPEYKLFGNEWEAIPRHSWSNQFGNMNMASSNSSYSDFILYTVKKLVEEFGLDGVYLDVSGPTISENPYHDSGYTDENGKKHPTASIWKSRELYKRLYTYLHSAGRNGVIFAHTSANPEYVGFVDVMTHAEEWGVERGLQYTRLSPDMFRTKEMRIQYGVPHTFYPFHQYTWRGNAYGTPVPFDEVLMMSLLHKVLPTIGDKVGGDGVIPIWDLMDQWITSSDFIPYWNPDSPAKTGSETVLTSIYNKPGKKQALMVVSNWGYKPSEANVSIDFKKMGGKEIDKIKMTEVYPGTKAIPFNHNPISFPLDARALKIIRVDY